MHRLFWVGCFPPSFRSVGDHAQTLAVQKFLAEHFSDYEVKRFYRSEINKFFREDVDSEDLIFIQSSGDFGDLYPDWHIIRKKIVASYPENRIVQLPVSVYYQSTANFEVDKIFFSGKPNLLILCRTLEGAELLRGSFDCRVEFFPDFVFYLKPHLNASKRVGCLGVFREDSESLIRRRLPKRAWRLLRGPLWRLTQFLLRLEHKKRVSKLFPKCYFRDAQVSDVDITDQNREAVIHECLRFYSGFKQVVSDRFHALVFSYLTGTPFIAVKGRINQKTTVNPFLDYESYFRGFRELVFSDEKLPFDSDSPNGDGVLGLIKSRRSVRKWTSQPVETSKLRKIVEAGVYAPSAANLQAVRFKVVTSETRRRLLSKLSSAWFRNSCPGAVVLVFYDSSKLPLEKWTERFVWQDTSCAMMNMMLIANSLGLKSCWASVTPEQAKEIKCLFGIAKELMLACMLFLGYSDVQVGLESRHQGRIIKRDFNKMVIK